MLGFYRVSGFNCGCHATESYPGRVNFGANQEIEYKP
jgi:hypothetical protein